MKKIGLILLSVGAAALVGAKTNDPGLALTATNIVVNSAKGTNASGAGLQVMDIHSDHWTASLLTHTMSYWGNVHADDPQEMRLRSDSLEVQKLPRNNGKYQSVIAETNVAIDFFDSDGQTNHVTGEKAVYTCSVTNSITNEVVVITGQARLVLPNGTVATGEPLIWDCIAKQLRAENGGTTIPNTGTNKLELFDTPRPGKKPAAPAGGNK